MNGFLSLLPPVAAIVLAFATRQVVLSLLFGLFAGTLVLSGFSPYGAFTGLWDTLIRTVSDTDNASLLLFSLLIGALVRLVQDSGGVSGFVRMLTEKNRIDSPLKAKLAAAFLGMTLFIEGSISILTVGTVMKPLFRKFRIAAEKLAYLADSTCAPVAVLLPLNGWGAYLVTQLKAQGVEDPVSVLLSGMPFFFYPVFALLLVFLTTLTGRDFGSMKNAEKAALSQKSDDDSLSSSASGAGAWAFLLPMVVLVGGLFFFMKVTGNGSIREGDGACSVLNATAAAVCVTFILYRLSGVMKTADMMRSSMEGMQHLLEVVMILALALSINSVCRELKTGIYVAGWIGPDIPLFLLPALIFVLSAAIAFATGTSWGTFAIMLGIAIPLASQLGLEVPLVLGAVVSGGVWGDHASPVSDTTVLSSLASDCDHIRHVRTQLPYAMIAGGASILAFLIAGTL